jgi:hypothetical protein
MTDLSIIIILIYNISSSFKQHKYRHLLLQFIINVLSNICMFNNNKQIKWDKNTLSTAATTKMIKPKHKPYIHNESHKPSNPSQHTPIHTNHKSKPNQPHLYCQISKIKSHPSYAEQIKIIYHNIRIYSKLHTSNSIMQTRWAPNGSKEAVVV